MEETGRIWRSLTPEQQQRVLDAYDESENNDNLISLEELKKKYDAEFGTNFSAGSSTRAPTETDRK